MSESPIDGLIRALAGLPGLGPRSARRIALTLLTGRDGKMDRLTAALKHAVEAVKMCSVCGNLDAVDPCRLCRDEKRCTGVLCIVAGVAGLWAIERTGAFRGRYHVLNGVLSALDGKGPDDLRIATLPSRIRDEGIKEVIMALSATVDGQATAHYLTDRLRNFTDLRIARLAHGVPVGGEIDHLDDGTLATALKSRAVL